MNPRHFSQYRAEHADGLDDPLHLTPTDLSTISPKDYAAHEGEPVMLTPELLDFVSDNPCDKREDCDTIEKALDLHYKLQGTGFGIAWDVRDKTARLVKL